MPLPLVGLFFIVLAIIAAPSFSGPGVVVGKPSPSTIKIPQTIEIVDEARTDELRSKRAGAVERQYRQDPEVNERAQARIGNFFSELNNNSKQATQLLAKESVVISGIQAESIVDELSDLNAGALSKLQADVRGAVRRAYRLGRQEASKPSRASAAQLRAALSDRNKLTNLLAAEFSAEPNEYYDAEATAQLRSAAAESVRPSVIRKQAGETIVRDGEIVTREHKLILSEAGISGLHFSFQRVLGVSLYILGVLALFGLYLRRQKPQIYSSTKYMLLLASILIVTVVIARIISPVLSPHLVPVPAVGMLTTVLFSGGLGLVAVLTASFLTAAVSGSLDGMIVGVMGGLLSVYLVANMKRRSNLVASGVWLTVGMGYLAFSAALMTGQPLAAAFQQAAWGLVGGAGSAILTLGLLPFLESAFNITTDLRLVELAKPNHPLLKDLVMKAPGTYSHSVMTGNLAEAAAESIGANPILARVGAYYHDVGKMSRPLFFIENERDQSRGHDRMPPDVSSKIITSHVSEGVALAKAHRLPAEVIDIISEHHGTSLVTYFYHQAQADGGIREVTESDFRYAGRLPRSKEAAIIMLADSVEAASRTLSSPSIGQIDQLIAKIVDTRLRDGQLAESDLTLADLRQVALSFSQVLVGMYHTRIEYPEIEKSFQEEGSTGWKS